MTTKEFAPKDAETLKSEILADLGIEYEGNEEIVEKAVARELKSEEFKASLHADKKKHLENKEAYKQRLIEAGFDPETGRKIEPTTQQPKGGETTPKNDALSPKDYLALTENKVLSEDFDEVMRLSTILGKTIAETLKDKTTKIILAQRAEERASALAASTGPQRRGTERATDDSIIEDFEKGKISDKDEDIQKLVKAQFDRRKAQTKGPK